MLYIAAWYLLVYKHETVAEVLHISAKCFYPDMQAWHLWL